MNTIESQEEGKRWVKRWSELKSEREYTDWINKLYYSDRVHFLSVDSNGNTVEAFYDPEEKIQSALLYRNWING